MSLRRPPRLVGERVEAQVEPTPKVELVQKGRLGRGVHLSIAEGSVSAQQLAPLLARAVERGRTVGVMHLCTARVSSRALPPLCAWLEPWWSQEVPLELEAVGAACLLAFGAIAMFPEARPVRLNLIAPPLVTEPSILEAVARSARTTIYAADKDEALDYLDPRFEVMRKALDARAFYAKDVDRAELLLRTAQRARLSRAPLPRAPSRSARARASSRPC